MRQGTRLLIVILDSLIHHTLALTNLICDCIAIVTVASALMVVVSNNPVNSVLWLIVAFVAVACYLITAGITFIGLSYIIVYVGAIAVLFLFVVMMLNIAGQELEGASRTSTDRATGLNNTWPLASLILLIGALTLIPMGTTIPLNMPMSGITLVNDLLFGDAHYGNLSAAFAWDKGVTDYSHSLSSMNQAQVLGMTLYTHGAFWLLIVSVLLMLAMLVPLAIAFTGL